MRRPTLNYLKTEAGSGLVLAAAAALALIVANSADAGRYFAFIAMPVPVRVGGFSETLSLGGWVRDALMPVLFLVLGMQIKFELLRGELSNPRRLALPAAAAAGGLIVPAVVFLAVSGWKGADWPAACATDVAFALAILGLAGPRLPASLRVLLMSVAIVDDLVAVAAEAALHAPAPKMAMIEGAAVTFAGLALLSRWRQAPFLFYAAGFVLLWAFVLKSGLDPALAGIAGAFTAPIGARRPGQESALKYFMDSIHPYVAYAVLPLFAFTAAGVSLFDLGAGPPVRPLTVGLVLALWLGKPLGVFGFAWLAVATRLARRPVGASWVAMLGVALLSGVGLSVSLFLLNAAPGDQASARLAICLASALSALGGASLLARAQARSSDPAEARAGPRGAQAWN